MGKSIVTINDKLGTIALGFSRAGFDVKAIYNTDISKEHRDILKENWGNIAEENELGFVDKNNSSAIQKIDCIAMRIVGNALTMGYNQRRHNGKEQLYKLQYILSAMKPRCFVVIGCRKNVSLLNWITDSDICLEYDIDNETIDIKSVTGAPVTEQLYFIIGTLKSDHIVLDSKSNDEECLKKFDEYKEKDGIYDKWYQINDKEKIMSIKKENDKGILCWNAGTYKEKKLISWYYPKVPLIVDEKDIRKITHREIARLKGIPDEYYLSCSNKSFMYRELMYSPNVQAIQKMALMLNFNPNFIDYQNREHIKGFEFEKIFGEIFENKGFSNLCEKHRSIDYIVDYKNNIYNFVFKIYLSNSNINNKTISICRSIRERNFNNEEVYILIIGNIVNRKIKQIVKDKYNVFVWDIENILWIMEEFPKLKNRFISLLSFNISDVIPRMPEPMIFERNLADKEKIDLKERLRKIEPGKETAIQYENLCSEIMRYIFAKDIEFYEKQKTSNDGLYRFDYCGKIKHGNPSEFFKTVKDFFLTKYIIFEYKNYNEEITPKEIYSTEKYLYEKALRKVAIIISRKGSSTNAQRAILGSLRESGKLIICLADEDVNKLIDMKDDGEEPSDYLENILDNMLMELSK